LLQSYPEDEYKNFLAEARKISPHKDTTKDDPYFALSLSKNKCPIWSDETKFKDNQASIKILTTKELFEGLNNYT
jgi:predicted nucleic acid-binding protein